MKKLIVLSVERWSNMKTKILKVKLYGGAFNIQELIDLIDNFTIEIRNIKGTSYNEDDVLSLNIIYRILKKLNSSLSSSELKNVNKDVKDKISNLYKYITTKFSDIGIEPKDSVKDSLDSIPKENIISSNTTTLNSHTDDTKKVTTIQIKPRGPPVEEEDEYVGVVIMNDYREKINKII